MDANTTLLLCDGYFETNVQNTCYLRRGESHDGVVVGSGLINNHSVRGALLARLQDGRGRILLTTHRRSEAKTATPVDVHGEDKERDYSIVLRASRV